MSDLIGPISQVGFPIVVSLLLLVRIEAKMEKLGQKIDVLSEKLYGLNDTMIKLTTIIDERIRAKR